MVRAPEENVWGRYRIQLTSRDYPTGLFVEHLVRRWESGPHALLQTLDDLSAYLERALREAVVQEVAV